MDVNQGPIPRITVAVNRAIFAVACMFSLSPIAASAAAPAVSAGSSRQAAATSQTPSATAPAGPSTLSSGVAAGGLKGSSATPTFVNVSRLPLVPAAGTALGAGPQLPLLVGNSAAYRAAKNSPTGMMGTAIGAQTVSQVDLAFAGINSFSEAAIQGGGVEPPDTQIAVGPTQIVEMVNETGQVYDKTGAASGSNFSLNTFFGMALIDPAYFATDPRILYDSSVDRWYATMLGIDLTTNHSTTNDSTVFLAISRTGDATGSWAVYQIYRGLNLGVNGTNLLCDQPKLGYSADKFSVACSDFDNSRNFYGAELIVASKAQGLAATPMTIGYAGPYSDVFGVVPAQNLGSGTSAYMVENLSPATYARLWTVTGDPAAGVAAIHLQTSNIAMVATAIPPPAPQPSSTTAIDTGDDRFMSAVVLNGELWTSGTAGCIPPGDVATLRSCMRVIQIGVAAASLDQSTTAGLAGKYIYYPTLSLSSSGDATIVYSMSSATDFPGLFSIQEPKGNGGSFVGGGPIEVGTQAYTGGRWGDYSAAAADLSNPGKVWVAGEWSTATGSAPGLPSWSTAIARIAAVPSVSPLSTASHQLYALTSSDGATWQPIDNVNLSVTFTPAAVSLATISGNADLYTDTIGYNQDIGVMLSGGSFGAGLGTLMGWKESGGFAGTFSPNAAFVQTEQAVQAGIQYTATLVWKTNRNAPGVTIRSGAGPLPVSGLSPSRLTAEWVPTGGNNLNSVALNQLFALSSSDGATWQPLAGMTDTFTPSIGASMAVLSGNADLYTDTTGYNQDIGIWLSGGTYGLSPGTLVAWKESGGFGGTFSPNAAFVQTVQPVVQGTQYTVTLAWKTNRNASGVTIRSGAGPDPGTQLISPTRLTWQLLPASSVDSRMNNGLYQLAGSDGVSWTDMDPSVLKFTFTPASAGTYLLSGNADLYTNSLGYNQDIAIFVSGGAYGPSPGTLLGWKESGGFGGTFSPNAAYVETATNLTASTTYTIALRWKTNKLSPSNSIISAGAGPDPGTHLISPTRLTVVLGG